MLGAEEGPSPPEWEENPDLRERRSVVSGPEIIAEHALPSRSSKASHLLYEDDP